MSVHYKFKAALDFSTVTFDGIHISVSELKKSIIDQKRLGKNADFDLQIINAQSKEVYSDENALIPKNTSVIVARVPITDRKKSGPPPQKENPRHHKAAFHQQSGAEVAKGSDLSSMDLTEEEKIKAMMTQSTADWDPSNYRRIRGANQHGRVPDSYRCNKCNQGGHWIMNCPNDKMTQPDVKKSTGIPRSFMVVVDSPDIPGALMTPEGRYAVPAVDHAAYADKGKGQQPEQPPKPKIPDDLLCALCNDLLTDALLIPCCANSYCDDCIRNHLLESDHECPGCHEKDISPTTLIPNRFLRMTVSAFKSDSGYSKPEKVHERPPKSPPKPEKPKVDGSRKLSLDELPDDLFPHSPKKIGAEAETSEPVTDLESTNDIYDFDSIPSPFASPKRNELKVNPSPQTIKSLSKPLPSGQPHGNVRAPAPGGQHSNQIQRKPYNVPHAQSQPPPPRDNTMEPPPPGFEVLPPGEDGSHRPPHHGPNGGPLSTTGRDNGQRDGGYGLNRGPPGQQPPHGQHQSHPPNIPPPSFNPMQPPPGFGSGPAPQSHHHGMQQGPHGPPGGPHLGMPPQGFGGPHGLPPPHGSNQNMPPYPNNYKLPGPPMNRGPMPPMHHGPPPPRHHMDHDEFGSRGRGRRPYGGPGGPGPPMQGRIEDSRREGESRPGIIEDPLKEFERIMREKDRRKKMATAGPRKRSKSRSFSPSPRRTSPYPPKRSRSRSFSRSPSPKRKRPLPAPKRRRSYSRSPSRTPPIRRAGKSRSRSRNRSLSPPPPGKIRRSPRRAPPLQYSPSPPPSRFSRKEKDEYLDRCGRDRERDRYDDRRFQNKPSSYSSRDYDGKYANPPPPKHDGQPSHKYDSQRQPLRPYHGSHTGHGMQHDQPPTSYRDKPPSMIEPSKRAYDYEPNIVPPGTENISNVPSLLDMNLPHPSAVHVYPISTIGTGGTMGHQEIQPRGTNPTESEKPRRENRDVGTDSVPATVGERKKSSAEDDQGKGGDDDKDHRRKKSPVGKKHKKEKKKHKKKSKDEKKEKKTKKSKSDKTEEGDRSSDDDADVENQHEDTQGNGNKALSVTEEQKIPVLGEVGLPTLAMSSLEGSVVDSSIGTAKQTAPCDSTVKSPDRVHETESGVVKDEAPPAVKGAASETLKRRDSLATEASHMIGLDVPDKKSSHDAVRAPAEELHLPPSRWDEYEDYHGETLTKSTVPPAIQHDIPNVILGEIKREPTEKKVTSEVLKRAEHAIFEKPSKAIADRDPIKPGSHADEKDAIRKFEKTVNTLPSLMDDSFSFVQSTIVQQAKPDLKSSSVVSTVYRKSAKDRLGSKVSEDEVVLNVSKTIESGVSIRSKVSAVKDGSGGDSSRKRRSRSRSPGYSGRNYRNRSRSREKDPPRRSPPRKEKRRSASRSRRRSASRERRSSPPKERRRSPSREKRRSPSRERRRSLSKERRRSPSREKRRSPSRERRRSPSKDRRRSPPAKRSDSKSRERRRSPSRERKRSRERRRSGSRDKSRRSRSPEKNKVRRSASPGRYRSRDRPRSSSREKSRRSRSPDKTSSRDKNRRSGSRDRRSSPFRRPAESSRTKEGESRRKDTSTERGRVSGIEDRREPSHFLSRSTANSSARKSVEEPPSPEARVFQQAGSGGGPLRSDQVFSPTLKKQKGRINIKLSSISKAEQQQSGSSSSDEEHEHHEATESKQSDSGEEGKRRKKRRHSSTSTKSSSSSDAKKKKKKKEKKKKKKKKKSK